MEEEWEATKPDGRRAAAALTEAQRAAIATEIDELASFRDLAVSITENAKGHALLQALETGFAKAAELGAPTRRSSSPSPAGPRSTWSACCPRHGYDGEIVLFNGTNTDPSSKAIYREWKERHPGATMISGSRDRGHACRLVERFRTTAKIMIATEAPPKGSTCSSAPWS